MSGPMNIDTSGWEPFDPSSPTDLACERERHAFTQYIVGRLKKSSRTGSDEASILTGAMMALTQLSWAMHDNTPPETAREAMHQAIDFSWLQCMSMAGDQQ